MRLFLVGQDLQGIEDFNPRTRERCDPRTIMRQMGGTVISIHAPVKGATGEKIVRKKNAWDISIHAPVKGATSRGRRFFPDLRISIHAPVKGAT